MSGAHQPGHESRPFIRSAHPEYARAAKMVEELFQGQFLVFYSPYRRQFTAIAAINADHPILDDHSVQGLMNQMKAEMFRAYQRPSPPRPPQRGTPSIDPPLLPRWGS